MAVTRGDAPPPASELVRAQPYVLAQLSGFAGPLHEVPRASLGEAVAEVVRVEGPVHVEEVARRIMDASGVKRLGSRIRAAVENAVGAARRYGHVERVGDFLYLRSQRAADVVPRDRSALPNGSRSFDYIAPEEVQATVREVVSSSFGIAAEDLPLEVCRMLGFGQTSASMRADVERALHDLQSAGVIGERHGMLCLTSVDAEER